jgi:RNA polymerase-binding transcription factor DksA
MGVSVKTTKKAAAKKPAAVKKPAAAKKPVAAKKPAAKKPVAAKKPAAKKPAATKKPAAVEKPVEEKKEIKRVPPRIIRKPPVIAKQIPPPMPEIDTAKAVAFAMSIAEEMKRAAAAASKAAAANGGIKLSRRPTTREKGQETVCFPPSDLKDFRKRLLAEREKALSGVDAMKATGFNEADDREADGGDGTNQTLRLQALGQMGTINRTIQQIEEALHRIEDGTYGVCTVCGQLIRKPRLVNQPFVQTCMECQNEMERIRKG